MCEKERVRVFSPARPPVPETALVYAGWPPAAGCSDSSFRFGSAPVPPPLPSSCVESQNIIRHSGQVMGKLLNIRTCAAYDHVMHLPTGT